jgi:hypothetical protein
MNGRSFIIACLLIIKWNGLYSQGTNPNVALDLLDKSHFGWKGFSFGTSWLKVKNLTGLEKIDAYQEDYQNYYCGKITDTAKSYLVNNEEYHEFNGLRFDQVFLHLKGSKITLLNYNELIFIRHPTDSAETTIVYKKLLQSLKRKFGDRLTQHLDKYRQENSGSDMGKSIHLYLNRANPFSAIDETEWQGYQNVVLRLHYVAEANLIILTVSEYPTKVLSNPVNWFRDAEYDENFASAFKEFDSRNGYKGLKFGMSREEVKKIIQLKATAIAREYSVITDLYRHWFYVLFDDCSVTFNKRGHLYDVSLLKVSYDDEDYKQLLKSLSDLFGYPTTYREKSGDDEFTLWKGKKLMVIILRPKNGSMSIDFNSPKLDDSSPADALY